jgi:phosphoribosylglycinamide formyltransferase 1
MQALADRIANDADLEVVAVVSPKSDSPGALAALERGLPLLVVPYLPRDGYAGRLTEALQGADWVCLAGYMKLLPVEVLHVHPGCVLNIHPALLPKFGGKGMYGHFVHEAVVAASEKESGCTVHYVTEEYDEGQIILQASCPVTPDDTAEDVAKKVLRLEHETYYRALRKAAGLSD